MSIAEENFLKIKDLLYGVGQDVPLEDNELMSVLLTYPACLVAAADGVVDTAERLFLLNVSEELGDGNVSDSPELRMRSAERYRAFMWLLSEKEKCDQIILDGLKDFLKSNEEASKQIKEMVWGMAEASEGTSEVEKVEISRICTALDISETIN